MSRNRGLKQKVVDYMSRNVDRTVTLDELERELNGHSRGSISSTMSGLCRDKDYPAENLGSGVYRWSSRNGPVEGVTTKDLMEVILVNEKDGKKVLLRDDHGGMWVARQVDLEEMM